MDPRADKSKGPWIQEYMGRDTGRLGRLHRNRICSLLAVFTILFVCLSVCLSVCVCVSQVPGLHLLHPKHAVLLLPAGDTGGHGVAFAGQQLLPDDHHGLPQHHRLAPPHRHLPRGTAAAVLAGAGKPQTQDNMPETFY